MNEQHAGPVGRYEQLREDGEVSGGQGYREARVALRALLVRREERVQQVAERGRVRSGQVVQVHAGLQL